MKKIYIQNTGKLDAAARAFYAILNRGSVVAFYGEMGSGKTTFIKHLVAAMGSGDLVTSPTFALVNEYCAGEHNIYHFDFYRIEAPREALDIGWEEYLDRGGYCFIEWPEKIEAFLPENTVKVKIIVQPDGARELLIELPAAQNG